MSASLSGSDEAGSVLKDKKQASMLVSEQSAKLTSSIKGSSLSDMKSSLTASKVESTK